MQSFHRAWNACLLRQTIAAVLLGTPLTAGAALYVYEPFDYRAPAGLDGTAAGGLNLQST
jgi:hypothetical protein